MTEVVPSQDAVGDRVPEPRSTSRWGDAERARERELIAVLASSEPGDPAHQRARDELVTMHLPLVQFLARRFRDRGEPLEDLVQVGTIGLIKAVDRFDPERGVEFSTYATPTIVGEIKRHFRDKGWAIRVPRRLQELRISIGQATAELSQRSGRSPTVAELATHLGISEDEVIEGLEGALAYSTTSLDTPSADSPTTMRRCSATRSARPRRPTTSRRSSTASRSGRCSRRCRRGRSGSWCCGSSTG